MAAQGSDSAVTDGDGVARLDVPTDRPTVITWERQAVQVAAGQLRRFRSVFRCRGAGAILEIPADNPEVSRFEIAIAVQMRYRPEVSALEFDLNDVIDAFYADDHGIRDRTYTERDVVFTDGDDTSWNEPNGYLEGYDLGTWRVMIYGDGYGEYETEPSLFGIWEGEGLDQFASTLGALELPVVDGIPTLLSTSADALHFDSFSLSFQPDAPLTSATAAVIPIGDWPAATREATVRLPALFRGQWTGRFTYAVPLTGVDGVELRTMNVGLPAEEIGGSVHLAVEGADAALGALALPPPMPVFPVTFPHPPANAGEVYFELLGEGRLGGGEDELVEWAALGAPDCMPAAITVPSMVFSRYVDVSLLNVRVRNREPTRMYAY